MQVSNLAFSVTEEEATLSWKRQERPISILRGLEVERGKRQLKTTLFGSLDSTTAIAEEPPSLYLC